ncbi:ribosome biogenesis GTP-binding protein YihA/YsxC [Paraferrimonas sedimenticola]|uniref:Probable GTP-binding protein EngB n=1 Tax=Paraferrimonas sedimenticola TaxID=375674 RepID=A0AA37W0R7_9GAMM|nr:ribosome biogenesis GTP-binding protein YihA/YsxC [Paraferrimonas sedimenticola]GLP95412.1 putative GTP-binding protein EngB [Paraferrimonas sedimenticola]
METSFIDFRQAKFLTSAPDIRHLGADKGIEIAFAGRSNAGKSSALNALTQQKSLARTSKTPGRTQLINVFELDQDRRLIDLPGYGFAQVPLHLKEKWQAALSEYLQDRESLCGIVVLMDIRHPLKDIDQQMIDWAIHNHLPVLALLTKCDKLKQGARKSTLLKVRKHYEEYADLVQVEVFSSLKKLGIPQLINWLTAHYQLPEAPAKDTPTEE